MQNPADNFTVYTPPTSSAVFGKVGKVNYKLGRLNYNREKYIQQS